MNETRQLAHFIAATGYQDLPGDVVEFARIHVLDNIASGLVGSIQPWSNMVAELVKESGCNGECTIMGKDWRSSPSGAALVNGTMIGAFETDHGYARGSAHPSGTVFPAAMAIAEKTHKDGKSFIAASVMGYETVCRVGLAATRAVEDIRGYHGPGTNGPFGAAAAAGKLLGFDEPKLVNALGIAGSHGCGLLEFAWEGAMTKRLHLGRAAQLGLECALLAEKGFTGPSTVLEGKFGFFNVFSPKPEPEKLLADIGKTWLTKGQMIKPHACHGTQLSIVQGLLEYKAKHPIDFRKITKVAIAGSHFMVYKHDDRAPKSIMGVQYSLPFVVAIALSKDIADPYVFNQETLWDPEVRELSKKVELRIDKRFEGFEEDDPRAEVMIEEGGKKHVINVAGFKGSPSNPLTFKDISDKFRRYAVRIIGQKKAEEVIDMVAYLEQLDDVAKLARLMGI